MIVALRFDYRAWCRAMADEVTLAEQVGQEEAVRWTAERFRTPLDRDEIALLMAGLKRRHRIRGEDAQAAFFILEAFYWEQAIRREPLRGRLKRLLAGLLRYRYPRPLLLLPERVVFAAPMGDGCPLLAACGQDLDKCRPFCQAHLQAGVLHNPLEMLLVEAAGRSVRWEIDEIRSVPTGRCYYAITSE